MTASNKDSEALSTLSISTPSSVQHLYDKLDFPIKLLRSCPKIISNFHFSVFPLILYMCFQAEELQKNPVTEQLSICTSMSKCQNDQYCPISALLSNLTNVSLIFQHFYDLRRH